MTHPKWCIVQLKWNDIEHIRLNMHPRKDYGDNVASGELTLVIETKKPHMIIEFQLQYLYQTKHYITGDEIVYYHEPEY